MCRPCLCLFVNTHCEAGGLDKKRRLMKQTIQVDSVRSARLCIGEYACQVGHINGRNKFELSDCRKVNDEGCTYIMQTQWVESPCAGGDEELRKTYLLNVAFSQGC